jgi:hypothetical protein
VPGAFRTAIPVTLRGEKRGSPIPLSAAELTITLGAYAPASFILE